MDIQDRINQIDVIIVNFDKEKLDLKLGLIKELLDVIEDKGSETEVIDSLKRVYWISYEVGSNKAFESSNLELNLVKKALDIARRKLSHNRKELLLYLKLNLLYSLNEPILHGKLASEISDLEKLT
jgi:hypothetical protein